MAGSNPWKDKDNKRHSRAFDNIFRSRRSTPNPETADEPRQGNSQSATRKEQQFTHTDSDQYKTKMETTVAADNLKVASELYNSKMQAKLNEHRYFHPQKLYEIHSEVSKFVIGFLINSKLIQPEEANSVVIPLQKLFLQFEEKNNMSLNGASSISRAIEPIIGIDLGTTNCCVGVYWDNEVKIFRNDEGDQTTPSYISFEEDDDKVIGKCARKNSYLNAENTIYDSKRMIGRLCGDKDLVRSHDSWPFTVSYVQNKPKVEARGRKYSPEEISAMLLDECRKLACKHLQRPITKAVITVPAYFNDAQRKATCEAAQLANLEVMAILNEPSAASLAYKIQRLYTDSRTVLVFDLGGGTFDVAVLEISNTITTLAVNGDAYLGGEDFDRELTEYCINEFKKLTGIDIKDEKVNKNIPCSLARLTLACEEEKKVLAKKTSTSVRVDSIVSGHHLDVKITRETFENLCKNYFNRMIRLVDLVLKEANLEKNQIEDIILVGGSTRIPKLQSMLKEFFNDKELNYNVNPDEAVAYGAAIQAAILSGSNAKEVFNINGVKDVIPMSIGIEAIVNEIPGQFSEIIKKNTIYPVNTWERFSTSYDYQITTTIKIYQGNDKLAENNFFLGEFSLEGIPPARKGEQCIDVRMEINHLGILIVTATSRGNGGSRSLKVSLRKHSYAN